MDDKKDHETKETTPAFRALEKEIIVEKRAKWVLVGVVVLFGLIMLFLYK